MHARAIAMTVVGLLLSSPPALAANRRSFFFGEEAAMTAGALIAGAEGTGAVFYNPAGLAAPFRTGLNLSLTAFTFRIAPIGDGFVVDYPDGRRTEDFSVSELLPTPSAIVFARNIGERWGFGLGAFVVETADSRFDVRIDRTGVPLPDTTATVATSSGLSGQQIVKKYNLGGGVGFEASSKLRLGWSLFAVYDRRLESVQYFSLAELEDGTNFESSFFSNQSSDVKSIALLAGFGLQWDVSDAWTVGLLAKTPTFSVYSWGDRRLTTSNPGDAGQVLDSSREDISEFNVQIVDPSSLELMVRGRLGRWDLGATFEVAPGIEQGGVIILSLDFLWNLRLGARYRFTETTSFGFGFFTDRSPTRRLAEPTDTTVDYYGFTSGVGFERSLNEAKTVSFTTSLSLAYLLGLGEVGAFILDPLGNTTTVSFEPTGVTFHEVAINLASGLRF